VKQVFKKSDDPEKFDEEAYEEASRRFEYDPWSCRGMAFTITSTIVLIVLGNSDTVRPLVTLLY